jgi:hypothetical protein
VGVVLCNQQRLLLRGRMCGVEGMGCLYRDRGWLPIDLPAQQHKIRVCKLRQVCHSHTHQRL